MTELQTDTIIHWLKSDITPSSNFPQASTHPNSSVFATVASYPICDSPLDSWEEKTRIKERVGVVFEEEEWPITV